ncbi:uncharacterized protein LOC119414315 [Nematolebias whitei]|uniref:uncharacterized protein LOC119414315 n=1 Tax=Nematolebias whitei TaxID=451745 RepID=UPI00189AB29F|nr:uncharacterized protein LOC119414315 [Nematolebias whitei]
MSEGDWSEFSSAPTQGKMLTDLQESTRFCWFCFHVGFCGSSRTMKASQRFLKNPRFWFLFIFVSVILFFHLFSPVLRPMEVDERHQRDIRNSTEPPAELLDPAALVLTPLVNTLINSSQSGSRQLFSLLSVTSYSSLAFHKLTLLLYNISGVQSFERGAFRRRFCYCVTNDTNDWADFTAVLLDVTGNSSSSLHEVFKSSSILSVSQRNNSDCVYICVMAGRTDGAAPELWGGGSITPLFNQTLIEGSANVSSIRLPADWHQPPTNRSHGSMSTSRVLSTALEPPGGGSAAPPTISCPSLCLATSNQQQATSNQHFITESLVCGETSARRSGPRSIRRRVDEKRLTGGTRRNQEHGSSCPWRRPERSGGSMTLGAHKLQPCVLELCRFFSQCLCRAFSQKTRLQSYCDDSHRWYETHTLEVCRRVKRVSFSRNLKQRCLSKMCNQL